MLKKTLGQTLKVSICVALFGAIAAFCEKPAAKAHEPSAEELQILGTAAASPEFNSSDGPNLRVGLTLSEDGEYNVVSTSERVLSPEAGSEGPGDWLRPAACAADVVVLGRVVGKTSALSANEATVITLYNFRIQTLYKTEDGMLVGKTISVLRRGGTVVTPQGVIRQEDLSVPPLAMGTDYILLLRELARTGGYVSAKEDLDFRAPLPSNTERVASIKGSGRTDIGFESLSQFRDSLEKALSGCGTKQ